MKQLLEAGVHFGHQTRRWNPKMRRFIFGERNGIYIIDLNQTLKRIEVAYSFVRDLVAGNGTVLFVGTKKQTQDAISSYANECGMPYINERWLGGMLTNFATISGRVKKMQEYERMKSAGDFEAMPKKEALILSRELDKLQRNLGGIRNMTRLPEAIFVIDTKKEHIAVTEANKLGLPIVAVDAVKEGTFIASRGSGAPAAGAPPATDPAAEERRAREQAEARRQAALQQQEREHRLAELARHRQESGARGPGSTAPGSPAPGEPAAAPGAGREQSEATTSSAATTAEAGER
jgi:small subunit ribosomal protein S2